MSYNPNAGGGSVADGSVTSAKLGGDITTAGKNVLTAADKTAQKTWLAHEISDVTGLQTALDGKAASSHTHTIANVTGLQTALDGKQAVGSYAAASHTHAQSEITNLVTDLAGKAASSHTHNASDINAGTINTARLGSGTANSTTFLRGDNTWATPAGGSSHWTTVTQASDATVNNSTTYQNSSLTFSVAANTKYHFKGVAFIDTGATADYKFQFTGPASPTVLRISTASIAAGATAYTNIRIETAFAQSRAVTGTGTNGGYVEFEGILHNGANAGSVMFQWGQNALEAVNTILRAGSYIEYSIV